MTQTMEQVIAESDRKNIKGALRAFNDYVQCKNYNAAEKRDLQSRITQIKASIESARERVGGFCITPRAIDMAETLAEFSTIDKLFIHMVAAPNAAYAKQYKVIDNEDKELFVGSFWACTDFMYAPEQEQILADIHIVPVEDEKPAADEPTDESASAQSDEQSESDTTDETTGADYE